MVETSISNKILALVNQTGIKMPVTLRLKNGSAICNVVIFGIQMQDVTMYASYADSLSGETHEIPISDIIEIET